MKSVFLIVVVALIASVLAGARVEAQTVSSSPSPVPAKLPYTAVHNPQFMSVSEVNFMRPEDRLIGIVIGKVAKAYPAGIVAQHGLVEDETPEGPIAIAW